MSISTDTGTRVHDITYGAGTVVRAHGTHVMVRWDNGDYDYMPVTSQHWVTAEPELIENIVRLLDIKDLVRETRPAYRARIQHLKSHRYEVEAMTPDQALALYRVLDALPYDDAIDYMAWIDVLYGRPVGAYEERCQETIVGAMSDSFEDFGGYVAYGLRVLFNH